MMGPMHASLLIDGLTRELAGLIARLVQSADHRPSLAGLPTRFFAELDDALRREGLKASLLAGLFGLKLRTYHDHVRRAREADARPLPLIGEVYGQIRRSAPATRWALDGHFADVHPKVFAAALDDLVDSGLVYRTGRGPSARYRPSTDDTSPSRLAAATRLIWVILYHRSPADRVTLASALGDDGLLDAALARLEGDGRIEAVEGGWRCTDYAILLGDRAGWPAAVYDHVRAVVQTLGDKLEAGPTAASGDTVGGSTYTFEVGPAHPLDAEVRGLLAETRTRLDALRARVLAHNAQHPGHRARRVVFYFGQHLGGEREISHPEESGSPR